MPYLKALYKVIRKKFEKLIQSFREKCSCENTEDFIKGFSFSVSVLI